MKPFFTLLLFASLLPPVFAAPVDVKITRPDGLTTVHHGQSKKALANGPATTVEGTLEVLHADDFAKGKSEYHYRVRDSKGKTTAINIDSLPTETHRAKVRVAGKRGTKGTAIEPQAETIDPSQITVLQAPTSALALPTNTKILVALVQYNGVPADASFGPAQAAPIMDQVVNFFNEASYGRMQASYTVSNLVSVPYSSPTGSSCDMQLASASIGGAALKAANQAWDPALFQYTVWVMPQQTCGWAGLAGVPGIYAYVAGSASFRRQIIAHEMGHNFGNYHAGSGGGVPGSMWGLAEYGDPYDTMGNNGNSGHYDAQQKRKIGWLDDSSIATWGGATTTYTLDPFELAGGKLYAVRILTNQYNRTYWLEYRQPVGWDYSSPDAVQVRMERPFADAGAPGFDDTLLLSEHLLTDGQSYSDVLAGITVTVQNTSAPPPVANNLLTNGGFENPGVPGYQYQPPSVPGWAFVGNSGIQKNGSAWAAPSATDGAQTAFVQLNGSLSQTLNLNAGSYTLKLMAAQRQCCTQPYGNPVNVTFDGANVGSVNPGPGFQAFSFPLTVSATGQHTLTFTGTAGPPRDVSTFIDSVTLQ